MEVLICYLKLTDLMRMKQNTVEEHKRFDLMILFLQIALLQVPGFLLLTHPPLTVLKPMPKI